MIHIAIPKEIAPGERRVAATPATVAKLVEMGAVVRIQSGAGEGAYFSDDEYKAAGATVIDDIDYLYEGVDVVLKVERPLWNEETSVHEAELLPEGCTLISFLDPLRDVELVRRLQDRHITAFGMEMVPRIARAQKMDALSSQSSVAGYKAMLLAANALGKYCPLLITAAGSISPAKVFVLGVGVAGLQAIATARRLGAVVEAFDVRAATKEQVESLGAKFVHMDFEDDAESHGGYAKEVSEDTKQREQELIAKHVALSDILITTAQVPGRPAPVLITEEMVRSMPAGSVIVDLAAPSGGNCELTEAGKTIVRYNVHIIGPMNLPSELPIHSSSMYARNVSSLLELMWTDGEFRLDFSDEILRSSCVTHDGEVVNEMIRERM